MKGTFEADKSATIFIHEISDDFDCWFWRACHCGCGYIQVFGFFDGEPESTRLDLITRDEARHMWE